MAAEVRAGTGCHLANESVSLCARGVLSCSVWAGNATPVTQEHSPPVHNATISSPYKEEIETLSHNTIMINGVGYLFNYGCASTKHGHV